MSGLYLTVWDDHKPFDRVLQPTKGGWPHITLAYTGKHVSVDDLKTFSTKMVDHWVMQEITLDKAYVNSFQYDSGEWRHDCLLQVDAETFDKVKQYREEILKKEFQNSEKFSMNDPHVTAGIYSSAEEAKIHVDRLNNILPIKVTITGITID